jgi:hypothetical protein
MDYAEHLLSKLKEESGEVIQEAAKTAFFGPHEIEPGTTNTNEHNLIKEIHDFFAIVEMLHENGVINFVYSREMIELKKRKVVNYAIMRGILNGECEPALQDASPYANHQYPKSHRGLIAQEVGAMFPGTTQLIRED